VVTSQHKARKILPGAGGEQERARQLEVEFGQLQLELSTWATAPRIEKIAREKLKMRTPETAKVITVSPGGGCRDDAFQGPKGHTSSPRARCCKLRLPPGARA
jgi:cell division protein FtsL